MYHPKFSIVIPIYNEQDNIPELYKRLTSVMDSLTTDYLVQSSQVPKKKVVNTLGITHYNTATSIRDSHDQAYEIIIVNDGSTDRSWQIVAELSQKDQRLKGLNLSRNFGHHIAITAGLEHAKGGAVLVMDGDLQDPPEEIPRLYEEFRKGYDLVYGTRRLRKDNYFRKICSSLFWKTIKTLTGFDISGNQSMLRVMSRRYVDNLVRFPERSRWLPGLYAWAGYDQTTIPIEHAPRFSGNTKYNLFKMLKLTFHAITSFSNIPLQLSGVTGLVLSIAAFIYAVWLIIKKLFFGISVTGWASLMVALLLLSGFQLIMLWLVGQYLGRVFTEVQGRPLYFVKEKTGDFGE